MDGYGLKIAACIVTLFLGVAMPLIVAAVFAWKRREDGIWRAWVIGAAGFLVPQLIIRPLIIMALSGTGYAAWAEGNPRLYIVVSACYAALLELAGRCAGAGLLRKDMTFTQALAAGMGHGGIESIILISVSYVNNLVMLEILQNGQLDAMIAEAAANGTDTAELTAAALAIQAPSAGLFLLAGLERILTMICQACMTVMVFYGFHRKQALSWLLKCFGIHFLIDCISLVNELVDTDYLAYIIIYTLLSIAAVLCLRLMLRIRRSWQAEACSKG